MCEPRLIGRIAPISLLTLAFTLGFVGVALLLSVWRKLGLGRDMVVAMIRSAVHLIAIGYVLKMLLKLNIKPA